MEPNIFTDFHPKAKEVCYFILDLTNLNLSAETRSPVLQILKEIPQSGIKPTSTWTGPQT